MARTRFLDSVFPDWPGRLRYFRVFIFSRCVLTMYGATKPVTSVSGTHILLLLCLSVTPGLGQSYCLFSPTQSNGSEAVKKFKISLKRKKSFLIINNLLKRISDFFNFFTASQSWRRGQSKPPTQRDENHPAQGCEERATLGNAP